jgi:hypothetical protein
MVECTIAWNSSHGVGRAAIDLLGSSPTADIKRTIVAFDQSGGGIGGGAGGMIEHNIVFGNTGGDGLPGYAGDNLFDNPYFLDRVPTLKQ